MTVVNKLARIREVFETSVANFTLSYVPTEYMAVDEGLVPFRSRSPLRQHMTRKPAKYSMKIWVPADANIYYIYKQSEPRRK
jgi:hypothetical protein